VIGEGKKFCAALIVPNFEHLCSWCRVKNIAYSSNQEMINKKLIINRIGREIEVYNNGLDHIEKVKKFKLLATQWDVETGELFPTLKLKRRILYDRYAKQIRELYENNQP
jgi:long-chain acyl-CoA synthetase